MIGGRGSSADGLRCSAASSARDGSAGGTAAIATSHGDPRRAALDARVLAFITEWTCAGAPLPGRADETRFDVLARELFAYQATHCEAYGRFCNARGMTPDRVTHWREIPPVPSGAFKELTLRSFPADRTRHVFRTSGTATARRGELHLDTLALYEASLLPSFVRFVLPEAMARLVDDVRAASGDAASSHEAPGRAGLADSSALSFALRILAPSPSEVPDSSLSHMFGVLLRELGARDIVSRAASGFDVHDGALDVAALDRALDRASADGRPVALCGTAFAFVHLLDGMSARGERRTLPPGSRVMETGGFKGRSRELSRDALYDAMADRLGVPPERIVNQYGMTELASQLHDSTICFPGTPRRKLAPPWLRVRIVDPETGKDVAEGASGAIVLVDLANTGSVAAIQTADLGRAVEDGIEVLGREAGAEARGCSIAADLMLERGARR